jgi:hypothetical protein
MSELLLISVPGVRIDAQGALLRVVLVPRLSGPGAKLDDYGLADWPTLVRDAAVEIRLRDGSGADLDPVPARWRSAGESAVWSAFFSGIAVKPYGGQQTYDDPIVAPTAEQAEKINAAYRTAAEHVGDPDVVREQLASLDLGEPPSAPPAVPGTPAFEQPDFHRAIALLREFPAVLRALGLIVELTVPAGALAAAGAGGEVSVHWPGAPAGVGSPVALRTAFVVSAGRFLPAPTETIVDGLVDLRKDDWEVATLDVDGAVARLSDTKAVLAANADEPAHLPALRTPGLMLVRRGRAAALAAVNARAAGNAGRGSLADGPPLSADDLVLGYRIDVRENGRDWHSLTRRVAEYSVNEVDIAGGPITEEGHVKPGAAVIGADGVLRTDEVVARWSGQSLALPRLTPGAPRREPMRTAQMPYDFAWDHRPDPAQAKVPELRFGSSYELRARVADLAGGGLELEPSGQAGASPLTHYRRYEPLAPPEVPPPPGLLVKETGGPHKVDQELLGPGGSLEVLVVRSDPRGEPADDGLRSYPPNEQRLLLPAPATFDLAERHGKLGGEDEDGRSAGEDERTWRHARRALTEPRASAEPRDGRHYTWLPDPAAQGVAVVVVPWSAGVAAGDAAVRAWEEEEKEKPTWPDYKPKTLILKVGKPKSAATVEWVDAKTAVLSLPPGGQAGVELSSALNGDFLDRFAVGAWLTDDEVASSAAISGRHPVITPVRALHVVHAVRRPLAVPAATPAATRVESGTDALIADPASPLFGIDRDSTVQVDVSARWEEWQDEPDPETTDEVLDTLPVGLDDEALPPIRHEFADTKHRRIAYTLTARSRFRQYFDRGEPDAAFVSTAQLGPVHVPSTERPPPPTVLSVVPAFTWEEQESGSTLTRIRRGGRLRVELGAPWYATGEGERLGLVVEPDATRAGLTTPAGETLVPVNRAEQPTLFTTAYRDPFYGTPRPGSQPTDSIVTGLAGEVGLGGDPDSGSVVPVAPYAVWYAEGRRFADIAFAGLAETAYCPFVRLCLARYQPHSLAGFELSTIVKPDPIALMPDRTLTVQRTDAGPVVTLSGRGPHGPWNRVEVRLESAAAGRPTTELTALSPESGLAGWRPEGTTTGVLGTPLKPIALPADGRAHRLVIREIEPLEPSTPAPTDPLGAELSVRTVFADVVAL